MHIASVSQLARHSSSHPRCIRRLAIMAIANRHKAFVIESLHPKLSALVICVHTVMLQAMERHAKFNMYAANHAAHHE